MRTTTVPLFISALLAFNACSDELVAVPTGSIGGNVFVLDTNGTALQNNEGVRVTIQGTAFSATTSPDGYWEISGVPAGSYDIMFEREELGYRKVYGYALLSGSRSYLPRQYMHKKMASVATIYGADADSRYVTHRTTLPLNDHPMIFMYSSKPDFDPETSRFYSLRGTSAYVSGDTLISRSELYWLYRRGFVKNDTVYVRAMHDVKSSDESAFLVGRSGSLFFSAAGPSVGFASFVMP